MNEDKRWAVYVVRCSDNSFYTGITTNVSRRLREHNGSTRAAKYTRSRQPVKLEGFLRCTSRSEASKIEAHIKKMTRAEKEWLIREWPNDLS